MDTQTEPTSKSDYLLGLLHNIGLHIESEQFDEALKTALIADEMVQNLPFNDGKNDLNQRYSNLITSLWVELEQILKSFSGSPSSEGLSNRVIYPKKILTEAVTLTEEFLLSKH